MSDQPDTHRPLPENTIHNRQTSMASSGLEPAISTIALPQPQGLNCVAIGIEGSNTAAMLVRDTLLYWSAKCGITSILSSANSDICDINNWGVRDRM